MRRVSAGAYSSICLLAMMPEAIQGGDSQDFRPVSTLTAQHGAMATLWLWSAAVRDLAVLWSDTPLPRQDYRDTP